MQAAVPLQRQAQLEELTPATHSYPIRHGTEMNTSQNTHWLEGCDKV